MNKVYEYSWDRRSNVIFGMGIAILGIMISFLMYKNLLFSIVMIPIAPTIKKYVSSYIAERRMSEYMNQFKDFLFLAATSVSAGRSMTDAIAESIPGLREIHGDTSILGLHLDSVLRRIRDNKEDDVTVLMDMAVKSGIEDVIDFVMIYRVCKHTGANLITSMNRASAMIIDKMTIEKEIREITKRKETEGMFIFAMPILIILFLNISSPDYIAPLYETGLGRIIMTAVIGADVAIFGIIRKITSVKL